LFTILYLEDKAFEFIKTYLNDYNLNIANLKVIRKDNIRIFENINKFIKIIKEVYKELYKEEKLV